MTDKGSFRPPKQWQLTENETITSFANWQSNIMYHLSLNNEFEPFLTEDGRKSLYLFIYLSRIFIQDNRFNKI